MTRGREPVEREGPGVRRARSATAWERDGLGARVARLQRGGTVELACGLAERGGQGPGAQLNRSVGVRAMNSSM